MAVKYILASGSPRRKELLAKAGIDFTVMVSNADESADEKKPKALVKKLSLKKAEDVFNMFVSKNKGKADNIVVIGADTVVSVDDVILGKPKTKADAVKMIGMLQGRNHDVYTGVTIKTVNKTITFAVKTKVMVYPMSKKEIERYADCGECMDKAGAYGIQGRFAVYVKGIKGDYNNVVGLPVAKLCRVLKKEKLL